MAKHNYRTRLESLKSRRTDTVLNKAFVAESFNQTALPETVRYVFEAMNEISADYTKKTYEEAERVQKQISGGAPSNVYVTYDYQGSVPLNTHIKLHSDMDILTFHNSFVSVEPPLTVTSRYQGDADADLRNLRKNVADTLTRVYYAATIKDRGKAISISGGSLQRKFDIIICNWLDTMDYENTNNKMYRGIKLYDKDRDVRKKDFPFTHMAKVEEKNRRSMGQNFKRVIRLLKTLKADAIQSIDLSSFLITSVMYHMDDRKYYPDFSNSTALLPYASEHLGIIIDNYAYRQSLLSPSGKENLFETDDAKKLSELKKLKKELDDTIEDLAEELMPGLRRVNENYGRLEIKNYYEPLQKANYSYRL